MPFDTAILDGDFMPMNHKTVQPIGAVALTCHDERGNQIEGWHHIVRGDNGKTIKMAPASYTLIQNDYAIEAIETALRLSKLDLTDARFGVDYSHDGARMFAQWILPAHTAVIREGVESSLRVVLLNSYDSSTALHARCGNFNWVCANQAVSGSEFGSFRFKHKGEIDLLPAVGKLATAAEEHAMAALRWAKWPDVAVSDVQARAVIASMPTVSPSQVDFLVHQWVKARDEDAVQGGANLWCLANVLTAWATHGHGMTRGAENKAYATWNRQKQVAEVLEGKLVTELAA